MFRNAQTLRSIRLVLRFDAIHSASVQLWLLPTASGGMLLLDLEDAATTHCLSFRQH
jgi:hypothetical protein